MAESNEERQARVAAQAARIRARAADPGGRVSDKDREQGRADAADPGGRVSDKDRQTSGTKNIDVGTAISRLTNRDKQLAAAEGRRKDNQSTDSSQ